MTDRPFGRPMIGDEERAAVLDVLNGTTLVHGPQAGEFETEFASFTGAPHAVSVSSCTAGMHLVYITLGLGAGDEVLVPAQTHVATAHAVALTGADPVFVDAEDETGNIDIDALEKAITPRTRVIAVVHYLGVPVDMPRVVALARRHGLFVLEDCALALGTRLAGTHAGLHGDAGVFSFYPVKHMTTAEGGMVVTRDGVLADRLRLLRAFGVDRNHGERKSPGLYDVVALGLNYRMSEIHAAIGRVQLRKVQGFLDRRHENHATLSARLAGIEGVTLFDAGPRNGEASAYCLSVRLPPSLAQRRAEIQAIMARQGIGTSVYYPHPVPRLTWYRERYGYDAQRYPVAEAISDRSIALPVGPHLSPDDMVTIAQAFASALAEVSHGH